MSDNWVVQNLQNALDTWNSKLAEIWQIITQSPENFKGGDIWNVIASIHGALQAIGYALLVLFFVVGVVKTCGSFTEVKKPEHALKLFIRFALAKGVITYGLELMMALYLWSGTDDGAVPYCAGDCQHHHGRCRIWERTGDGAAAGDHYRSGGLRIF